MAVWSTQYVNDLPDSAFAYIEPGGEKDSEGKTVPRSKRHLPYKDKNGNVDAGHVRNALARLPQTDISEDAKAEARKKLVAAAKKVGVNVAESKKALDIPFECPITITKSYEDGEKWYIEGYAGSTELDLIGDIITEEAFKKSEQDLVGNSTVLYNHDPEQPIGKVEATKATAEGLWIKALISKTVPDIWQKVKEGVLNKFSIRGRVKDAVKRFIKEVNGKIVNKVVNIINEIYLIEASLVALPANPEAKALRWYISKSLQDFELKGGEIPKESSDNSKGEDMLKITELLKQITDRLVADEDKALVKSLEDVVAKEYAVPLKKKSGETWSQEEIDTLEQTVKDLQSALDIEKAKKVKKPVAEMSDEEMKEVVVLSDEIRKQFADKHPYPEAVVKSAGIKKSSGDLYAQSEIDAILKSLGDSIKRISDLEKEIVDLKAEKELEKRWQTVQNEYDEADVIAIKSILKKSILGVALNADETEALVTKKIKPSALRMGSTTIISKEMTEDRKQTLLKAGGIKTRVK